MKRVAIEAFRGVVQGFINGLLATDGAVRSAHKGWDQRRP